MDGVRHSITGPDGVSIGLLTAGSGPPLLLVHGGAGQIESWDPVWERLTERWRVTAMDRRGRGSSGDGQRYSIGGEYGDVAAVATALAGDDGPVDVFGHSYGAACTIGAARLSAPFRRIVLYEPPAGETVTPDFVDRLGLLIDEGQSGRATVMFLTEVIGLDSDEVDALRAAPPAYDILAVVAATLPREGHALQGLDLPAVAAGVALPVHFLLGELSPAWAGVITRSVAEVLPDPEVTILPGLGHEAISTAPDQVVDHLERFLA
jgi:pimeloyl-ACP methyl ester carboxylesterase